VTADGASTRVRIDRSGVYPETILAEIHRLHPHALIGYTDQARAQFATMRRGPAGPLRKQHWVWIATSIAIAIVTSVSGSALMRLIDPGR
jgi:hypothetical protein